MDQGRILVIGAGVNGSVCAAGLYRAGMDVVVLARGARYEELRGQGIVIEDPFNHKRTITKLPVIERLNPDDRYDFVLVVVRKNQIAALLPVLAQNSSPNLVFMGNNLAGPAEITAVLGRERVMLGAVYAAGKRDGSLIRAMAVKGVAVPFGELDGSLTPRLKRLLGLFRRAGFKAQASPHMIEFQATHAAGVALIGKLALKHGSDTYALARATDDLRLFVDGRREVHAVLRALGHEIVPASEAWMDYLPDFIQVTFMRMLLASKLGEVGLGWHCSQAPDEICQLACELQGMVAHCGLSVPAVTRILESASSPA